MEAPTAAPTYVPTRAPTSASPTLTPTAPTAAPTSAPTTVEGIVVLSCPDLLTWREPLPIQVRVNTNLAEGRAVLRFVLKARDISTGSVDAISYNLDIPLVLTNRVATVSVRSAFLLVVAAILSVTR